MQKRHELAIRETLNKFGYSVPDEAFILKIDTAWRTARLYGFKEWEERVSVDFFKKAGAIVEHLAVTIPATLEMQKEYASPGPASRLTKAAPYTIGETDTILGIVNAQITSHYNDLAEPLEGVMERKEVRMKGRKLIKRIKDKVIGKTTPTIPVIQIAAVVNFIIADLEREEDDDFIGKVFEGVEGVDVEAIERKLERYAGGSIVNLLQMIGDGEKGKLITYVLENFTFITPGMVERSFLD